MARVKTDTLQQRSFSKKDDYSMLIKLRLSIVVVFTSVLGYIIAAGAAFSWTQLILLISGGMLVTGAANALNQVFEKDFDVLMARTKERPIAAGRMKSSEAVMFAGISCLVGITILSSFNPLTGLLGMISLIIYSFVYTPLKRYSTIAVAVGAIPGALPVLIGYTAFGGEITILAIALFSIQFLWQFPHFWAIGFLAFDDYRNAGYKLLPEVNGEIDKNIGLYAGLYAFLTIPVGIWCFMAGYGSISALIITLISSTLYALFCYNMYNKHNRKSALLLMFSSFFYLPVVLSGYLIGL
ncbi:MAG: protoheme IX farnesyltransferase [Saprospiraceae bacterium]|nr:protoheme IX farnesyltransferase [Saprospiraceae bacterium]